MKARDKLNIQKTYEKELEDFLKFGNMNALSVIYEDIFNLLLNYGRKYCREEVKIEDAIQNIFTNLIQSRERLGVVNNVRQYLMTSFRNEIINLISKSRKTIASEVLPDILFKPEYSIEEEIIQNESYKRLKKILNDTLLKLTSHQQEILYLKYDMGLSYDEISATLNLSVSSCRTAVYRSIKSIKIDIEAHKINNMQFFCILAKAFFKEN